ncbi:hypothetical protein Q1695_008789 [Nippostrongylus brasiliensis]|nr:hypothetical protein Q1695_008789 [Nippostrongylus brasiliensis]
MPELTLYAIVVFRADDRGMGGYNEGWAHKCKSYVLALSRASKLEDAEMVKICSEVAGIGTITIGSGGLRVLERTGFTVNLEAVNRSMYAIQRVKGEPQTEDLKYDDDDHGSWKNHRLKKDNVAKRTTFSTKQSRINSCRQPTINGSRDRSDV